MSGNVKEWVNGTDGEADGLGGGSFADGRIDLRCENILVPQGDPGTGFGFRCCK